ncbi:MAG TPA: PqiC family protein [Opitutaceae bacterium]|nr:PqiC family protein [Opitutaceae bacterium]
MLSRRIFRAGSGLSLFALLALAGCNVIPPVQPDVTRYYVLSGPTIAPTPNQSTEGALQLGLRPVELAPYLRRGSLVVRAGDNEVAFANDQRWAEPLEKEIGNALRQRLVAAPTVMRVFVPPFPFEPARDFDVGVQVLHCEGAREGGRLVARFAAIIEISTAGADAKVVTRKTFVAPEAAWDGKDFARLASLLSDAVAALSQEVVSSLPEKK